MTPSTARTVSILLLAFWLTPSVGSLAVGVHLALDHHAAEHHAPGHHATEHHAGDGERARAVAELLRTATHGHRHDPGVAPDHEHQARLDGLARAPVTPPDPAALPSVATASEPTTGERSRADLRPRRGPPLPLFTCHCSLLL